MKRIFSIVLALIMCVGIMGTLFVTGGAEETVPTLEIKACNLSFLDSVAIKYAVKADSVDREVKLLVWTAPVASYTLGTETTAVSDYYIGEADKTADCHIFDYTDLVAKQMTDVVYARACIVDGDNVYYSSVVKYSILQYAYNKLGKTGVETENTKLKLMLEEMLEYGAAAQKYFDYKSDRPADADWVEVKLTGGRLGDGFKKGLYLPGDKITVTAPATDAEGVAFSRWEDSKGNEIATTASFELTVGMSNEEYTPVYGAPHAEYSEGLSFYVDRYDEAYVGVGSCTDTAIKIPPTSPDGYVVVGVDRYGFENMNTITSVSLPSTVNLIDRDAFNGCTALTDVYYDGTEEEWSNIRIESGNDDLLNATMHFKEASVETFTVVFTDYDGRVLKTETVEKGKSATSPAAPERANFVFTGWDQPFDNITSDLTATATYAFASALPTLVVHDAIAHVGDDTVDVIISLENNPGIASLKFAVAYDEGLTLKSVRFDAAYGAFVTAPEPFKNPQNISFMNPTDNTVASGTFAILTFELSDTVGENSVFDIDIVLDEGNIFDKNFENVAFETLGGKVIIDE